MLGSEASDGMEFSEGGTLRYLANHNGGINGGITNGEPLTVRVAVKPTPTISAPQRTVNLGTGESITHSFGGRHDPCIVPRAVPVVESAVALALLDLSVPIKIT
jgi:chorismate synthase